MLIDHIFSIQSQEDFEQLALRIFQHQYINNPIYQRFCNLIGRSKTRVQSLADIPFLPIEFFKTHTILSSKSPVKTTFTSSGTTGSVTSKHHVTDLQLYEDSFNKAFEQCYGNIEEYTVLALLPSYLEREGSSLIYMVQHLINKSNNRDSGFYLNNITELRDTLKKLSDSNTKTLLIGVSFALLGLVEQEPLQLSNSITVLETGGMKGKRKELIREELHQILKQGLGVAQIHSEYGMTELLSQAYATANGRFQCPPWMQVYTRSTEDPLSSVEAGKTGGINIIDLANINSCAFIATQDLGKKYPDGSFEVLGRFDHSDIRGCNLMAL